MSVAQRIKRAELLELRLEYNRRNKLDLTYKTFYPWQRKFNAATHDNTACLLMAGNQVGKSRTGCVICAYHLTGQYPHGWAGHTFDFPPTVWMLGYSGEKTRDLLQKKLIGSLVGGEWQGGYIPQDLIIDTLPMTGTPRAVREVRVKHVGGVSTVQFWSYHAGAHALMGSLVDFYMCDEEPEDHEIYPQLITRVINGDRGRGGRGILTFTPENGKTELVSQFMDEIVAGRYLQTATWDDAPHIGKDKQKSLLAMYPPYQRDMRSKGIPLMGAGLIYAIDENLVSVDPFKIPLHFKVINGMDFGWDHPQAHIQLAIDEENEVVYVTHAFKRRELQPWEAWQAVKGWSQDVPVAWPQDGLQTRENGKEKRDMYIESGFNLTDSHATWEGGGVSVHAGIVQLNGLFQTGQLRIFSNLVEVFDEIRQYHTKTMSSGQSQIVKIKDDLLDAIRYAFMMRREAVTLLDLTDDDEFEEHYHVNDHGALGY